MIPDLVVYVPYLLTFWKIPSVADNDVQSTKLAHNSINCFSDLTAVCNITFNWQHIGIVRFLGKLCINIKCS